MQMRGTITSGNDIYFYFEMLRQLSPKRVLDVGMFLKRIGAVSRQAMATELSSQIQLWGVDLFPEVPLPIYEQIYDEVLEKESFFYSRQKLMQQKNLMWQLHCAWASFWQSKRKRCYIAIYCKLLVVF